MKPSIFKYILKKTFKDKSYIFFRIIYVIAFILILGIFIFKDGFFERFNYELKNNISFRTLWVLPNDLNDNPFREKIDDIDHVVDSYNSQYSKISIDTDFKSDIYDGKMAIEYRPDFLMPPLIDGRNIDDSSAEYEIICPKKFLPNSEKNATLEFIEGKTLIGKTFTGSFQEIVRDVLTGDVHNGDSHERTFKIVGVYDDPVGYDLEIESYYNTCFITKKNIAEMCEIETKHMYDGMGSAPAQIVIVDKRENVSKVISEIEKLDAHCMLEMVIDANILKYIEFGCNMIIALVAAVLFLITVSYIKKKVNSDSTSIGLLKSFGFSKKYILINYSLDVLISILMSIMIGSILVLACVLVYNNMFSGSVSWISNTISISLLSYVLSIIIILIIPTFINAYYVSHKQRLSVITLLNGEEYGN